MNQFVVIGGSPRSGTNLARRVIGSHSEIAIPTGEFQFFNQLSDGKTVADILKNPRLEKWGLDLTSYYDDDPGSVYVRVLERYASKANKSIPGEKTPSNEFYYTEIKEALKDYNLKFVHMIRNPFDVMASYKHMQAMTGGSELNRIRHQIGKWVESVSLANERALTDPEHYKVVRHEDMASDPVTTARSLCEFIGVEFEENRMLDLADFSGHRDNSSFPDDSGSGHLSHGLIKAPVSRKSYLSSAEIRQVSMSCGVRATESGYSDPDFLAYQQGGRIRSWFYSSFGH